MQILLGVWDSIDKGLRITKPTMDEKRKILRHVAYTLQTNGQKDISRQDFVSLVMSDLKVSEEEARLIVRQIEVRSWLIVERVIDRFAFSHLTLQEFFVVEYLHIERQDTLDFAGITDWNVWREPVLLMCGRSADPTTFIEQIAAHNIVLALLCIAEADSTLLNTQRIRLLLGYVLGQMHTGNLVLIDLMPALVSLLIIEKSPFSAQITDFVKVYFRTLDKAEQQNLVKTIANSGTREAARLLLYLHQAQSGKWLEVLDGLLLIGGTAVEEALQWQHRSELGDAELSDAELSDAELSTLLLRSYTPEATRALWERYVLEPEKMSLAEPSRTLRVVWAESWACRLALPENDHLMRTIPYNGPVDTAIWPYRKSQRTALAAIVQKCVQILCEGYKGIEYKKGEMQYGAGQQKNEEFVRSVEHIAQFDLRVQIPLLVQLEIPKIGNFYPTDGARIGTALGLKSSDRWHNWDKYLNESAWYALVATGGRRSDENLWLRVGLWVGLVGQWGGCILLWAGVSTLLWHVLPGWLLVAVIVVLVVMGISGFILELHAPVFLPGSIIDLPDFLRESLEWLEIVFLIGYIVVWIDEGGEAQRLWATGKMNFWYPIVSLVMAVVCGVLGGFAIQAWFHLALPLSMLIVGSGCLLFSVLQTWMSAFSGDSMRPWLEEHPRGRVVLDEFQE